MLIDTSLREALYATKQSTNINVWITSTIERLRNNGIITGLHHMLRTTPNTQGESETYYVAICRYDGNVHNFVMSGRYNANLPIEPYCFDLTAGKFSASNPKDCCPDSCAIAFSSLPAYINYEVKIRRMRRPQDKRAAKSKIYYQAYEVTHAQYNEFNNRIEALRYRKNAPDIAHPTYGELSLGNTCKHTGIAFLNSCGIYDNDISKSFLSRMYNRLTVKDHMITTPVFILPAPLTAAFKESEPLKYFILKQLRANLVRLANTGYTKDIAAHKVNALRYLFNRIMYTEMNDPELLLDMITSWEEEISPDVTKTNAALMNVQRDTSWLSIFNPENSSTTTLLTKVKLHLYHQALAIKLPSILAGFHLS